MEINEEKQHKQKDGSFPSLWQKIFKNSAPISLAPAEF
jgi:hypothetical protein